MKTLQEIQQSIKEVISNELSIDQTKLVETQSFHNLGLDSVNSIFLLAKMEERLGIYIDPMSVYDNPTIQSFSEYLHSQLK